MAVLHPVVSFLPSDMNINSEKTQKTFRTQAGILTHDTLIQQSRTLFELCHNSTLIDVLTINA
jgi:hypothetical protein